MLGNGALASPSVDAFGGLPILSEPALAPDGKHFAAMQEVQGRPVAVIYTVGAGPKETPAVVSDSEGIVLGLSWVKNDRLVVYVKVSKKLGTDDGNLMHTWARAVSVDVHGEDPVVLLGKNVFVNNNTNAAIIVDRDLDDPDNVFMSLYTYSDMRSPGEEASDSKKGRSDDHRFFHYDLYRVNVRNGDEKRIAVGTHDTKRWFMDGHGKILAREDESTSPLRDHTLAYVNDGWVEIGNYQASGDNGAGVVGVTDDGTGLARFVRSADQIYTLARQPLNGGAESVLFSNPTYDVNEALQDAWTDRVIGVAYIADKTEYAYFDPAFEALQKGLEAAFPSTSVHAVSWNTALDKVIVAVDAPRKPPRYFYLDRTTHKADDIGDAYPNLEEADLGEMKPYPYKARDGLDIPAYLTLPPGKTAKGLPAIIMPHGGPDARDSIRFDWWAQFLANRGYAVLQPNFRGSAGYGGKFTQAGLLQWGLKMQDDLSDGVAKLVADGIADPKRICIVGASYGGYAALAGATFTPELYACAVSFAGISDLPHMLSEKGARFGKESGVVAFWRSRIGSPYDDSEQMRATSPARHADKVKCPVLLLHGEGDTTVPIEQSEAMDDALKSAGKSVQFIRFAGEDHYMNLADTRIKMLSETEKFLDKNIGH